MERSVNIPVAGMWPSPEELAARNAAMASLDAVGIGTCTGAGGGMGEMDFSYRVTDEVGCDRPAIENGSCGKRFRLQLLPRAGFR